MLLSFTDHIDLHLSGSVKTITVRANNQDVSIWFVIFAEHRPNPGSGSGAQVDDIEPEEDKVEVGELRLLIFWMFLTKPPHGHHGRTVQLLSEVKHHQCHSSGVSQKQLMASVEVLMATIVPNVYKNTNNNRK